jgi:hypothetical protein
MMIIAARSSISSMKAEGAAVAIVSAYAALKDEMFSVYRQCVPGLRQRGTSRFIGAVVIARPRASDNNQHQKDAKYRTAARKSSSSTAGAFAALRPLARLTVAPVGYIFFSDRPVGFTGLIPM